MHQSYNVKCKDCGDIFRVEYDSRKQKQNEYTCKCGKLICVPNVYACSYNNSGNPEHLSQEKRNYTSAHYPEDYISLSDECTQLLFDITELGYKLNQTTSYAFENYTDKDSIDLCLSGNNRLGEETAIRVSKKLCDDESWGDDREKQEENILEALKRFKSIEEKVLNGEINLNNPKAIYENDSLEWYHTSRLQKRLYDYEFLC